MAKIHILGAGTPTPTPDRFGSAFAVQMGGEAMAAAPAKAAATA